MPVRVSPAPLSWVEKIALTGKVWQLHFMVRRRLRRSPLPETVRSLAQVGSPAGRHLPPPRLGRIVHTVLALPPYQPRCLIGALILFRLLREQGDAAQLVIGMPVTPQSERAHAWVEVDRVDAGPPPGHGGHRELARYG